MPAEPPSRLPREPFVVAGAGSRTGLRVTGPAHSSALPDGRLLAVVGTPAVPGDRLAAVLPAWIDAGCPMPGPVRTSFLAVLADPRTGAVTAVTGARLTSAAVYAVADDGALHLSDHPRGVVAQLRTRPEVDTAWLASWVVGSEDAGGTPLSGVHLLGRGHVLTRTDEGVVSVRRWFDLCAVEPWSGSPSAEAEAMRAVVADAVAASLPTDADVGLSFSGGLDSAMIAGLAGPAQASAGHRVHALTHVPTGEKLRAGLLVADDLAWARLLVDAVPGIDLEPVENTDGRSVPDVLTEVFASSWLPCTPTFNSVWLTDLVARTRGLGLDTLLVGRSGNVAFSVGPHYPWRTLLTPREPANDLALVRSALGRRLGRGGGTPGPGDLAGVDWTAVRAAQAAVVHPELRGARSDAGPRDVRQDWLRRMQAHRASDLAWSWAATGVHRDDVFSDPHVLTLAASLPPQAWTRGGTPRSLARRAGAGVVPADVLARPSRGLQSADAAHWLARRAVAWRAAADLVRESPSAAQVLDVAALHAAVHSPIPADPVARWAWGATWLGPLTAGLYAAWWDGVTIRTG